MNSIDYKLLGSEFECYTYYKTNDLILIFKYQLFKMK